MALELLEYRHMLVALLNAFFGCSHQRTTFPISPPRKMALSGPHVSRSTYVVCLECGQEFGYDWQKMRVGEPFAARPSARAAESAAKQVNAAAH
jgi:hypothetical protein